MTNNLQILTGKKKDHLKAYQNFLLEEQTLKNFLLLKDEAKKDLNADLSICSAFRSFEDQCKIWNEKAMGLRKILNDQDEVLDIKDLSEKEIVFNILRFSALPGMSRHHWGTEIDIFDSCKLAKEKMKLIPSEWCQTGPFHELNIWLEDKIKNNLSFGFFRPYQIDQNGIHPEAWHLSYKPLSQTYYTQYNQDIILDILKNSDIKFSEIIIDNLDEIFNRFFKTIFL